MKEPDKDFIVAAVAFVLLASLFTFVIILNEENKRKERQKPCKEYSLVNQPPRCWE